MRSSRIPIERCTGRKIVVVQNHLRCTETLTESTVRQWNSSAIFSQDSRRCSSVKKSKVYCWELVKHQRISQEELYSCRCSTTSLVDQETMNKNAWRMSNSFLCMHKDLEQDNGHLLVLVLNRIGIPSVKIVHKENGTKWRKGWCWNSKKADIPFPVLQVRCPEVGSKTKAIENCCYIVVPISQRLRLFSLFL